LSTDVDHHGIVVVTKVTIKKYGVLPTVWVSANISLFEINGTAFIVEHVPNQTRRAAKMLQPPKYKAQRLKLAGIAGLVMCANAAAQTAATVPLDRQTEEVFRQVFQQPQDLSLWSKYAQLLVQAGNYEGGIAALERLLLNPDASPDIRVDIAALYFRLESYAMSEAMLNQALADGRLQGEKRAFAQSLLAAVAKRNQRSQFSGSVSFGLRHQTNPMYRTGSAQVLSAGVLGPLPANQQPQSDNDVSVGLRIQHAYDLEKQNSAAIVSGAGAYLMPITAQQRAASWWPAPPHRTTCWCLTSTRVCGSSRRQKLSLA
jgi:tetratricopeptide (TPR) repeat protein